MNNLTKTFTLKVDRYLIYPRSFPFSSISSCSVIEEWKNQTDRILGKGNWYASSFSAQEPNEKQVIIKMEVRFRKE